MRDSSAIRTGFISGVIVGGALAVILALNYLRAESGTEGEMGARMIAILPGFPLVLLPEAFGVRSASIWLILAIDVLNVGMWGGLIGLIHSRFEKRGISSPST